MLRTSKQTLIANDKDAFFALIYSTEARAARSISPINLAIMGHSGFRGAIDVNAGHDILLSIIHVHDTSNTSYLSLSEAMKKQKTYRCRLLIYGHAGR